MSAWTDEVDKRLRELRNGGYSQSETAERLSEEFGYNYTRNAVKNRESRMVEPVEELPNYKSSTEILADGSYKSDKLIRMNAEQEKDVDYLLDAHGFDIDKWDLVTAKNNIWNVYSKQDGVSTLYSSKITVKPKVVGFDWDQLLKKMESIKGLTITTNYTRDEDYLNIPLFDMHFGPSKYNHYKQTQHDILLLLEKGYKEVLFIIGQDLIHNDDFRGRTSSGREIEKVNMELAWEEAMLFYMPIISKAIETSKKVSITYSKGNHDESMSWAFVKCLQALFPQATFDTRFKERKVHMLGQNFIGINHGDKKKDLTENFATEFPLEWSRATTREIFTGHLHTERVIDKGGIVTRRMPTGNETDSWHDDYGYTTAHKRFEVFEYTEEKVKRVHYV